MGSRAGMRASVHIGRQAARTTCLIRHRTGSRHVRQLEENSAARVVLAIACRILSEFSVACLERLPFSERGREGVDA